MVNAIIKELNNENLNQVLSEYNKLLKQEVDASKSPNIKSFLLLNAMNNVMDNQSQEQIEHLEQTAKIAQKFAKELNLKQEDHKILVLLARYHDIGKINISKDILNKPGKLNNEEWNLIKKHPVFSYNILKAFPRFEYVAKSALHHHERFDGTGYPHGLSGTQIPLLSRIISILDTYEVLTSGRVYKAAISVSEALKEIKRCAGTQFDPILVSEFVRFISKHNKMEDFQL